MADTVGSNWSSSGSSRSSVICPDDHSARAWLHGKLLLALVEKVIRHAESISPWGYELAAAAPAQRLA